MDILKRKIIIALLWIIWAMSMSVFMFVRFLEPGVIQEVIGGSFDGMSIGEGRLLFLSFFWFIAWILAYLSLVLKDIACHRLNFTLGIIATIALFIGFILRAMAGHSIAMLIDYFLAVIATALIAWHARKIPTQ